MWFRDLIPFIRRKFFEKICYNAVNVNNVHVSVATSPNLYMGFTLGLSISCCLSHFHLCWLFLVEYRLYSMPEKLVGMKYYATDDNQILV